MGKGSWGKGSKGRGVVRRAEGQDTSMDSVSGTYTLSKPEASMSFGMLIDNTAICP